MFGVYVTIGILLLVILLLVFAAVYPKVKKYRLVLKAIEPRKKRRAKPMKKKRKSIWIKVI
jgi:hypothetical protein